jgi:hypothetical protein
MDAAIWTALGLLAATSLGTLFYLGSRIDAVGSRIDALSVRMDARFDGVDARLDAVNARIDAHLERHAG